MRLLLLVPVPPDENGSWAIPALLHAQLRGLSEENDVTVVTPAGPDPAELLAAERLRQDGWEVHVVPRHSGAGRARWTRRGRMAATWLQGRQPWRTVWFHEPALQPVLDVVLAAQRFDVVAVQDNAMATYTLRTDAATVLTELEVKQPRSVTWRPGRPSEWAGWAFREVDWYRWQRYQRYVWRQFDKVHFFTDRDAALAKRLAPECSGRFVVSPFGVDVPDLAVPVPEEPATVLFVGNFHHPPNVDAAIWLANDILPRVRQLAGDARLWLVGPNAPREVLDVASASVEVLGFVSDLSTLIRRATVVAAPVRRGGGMRMKVLHAMSLGRPVVMTSRGAEGLEGAGEVVPAILADDAENFATAIVRLLHSQAERRALGDQARAFVIRHHSPSAYGARLQNVYEQAVRDHAGKRLPA